MLPVCKDTRHAGSVVGKGWPDKSSREPQQIAAWFAGTDFGIALHCNKSGAFVLDIDKPDRFRHWHLVDTAMVQNTRPDTDARRGHYCWLAPDGFYSNSPAGIGTGWGEVRASANGVIIAAPGIGDRRWLASGPLQPLPLQLVAMLREGRKVWQRCPQRPCGCLWLNTQHAQRLGRTSLLVGGRGSSNAR